MTLDRLSADPKIAKVLAYPVASSSAMFDLLGQIDRATSSSTNRVVNAILPDGAADPDPAFSQLLDRLIDNYHLTVILQGGFGMQANAITVGPPDASALRNLTLAEPQSQSPILDPTNLTTHA